MFNIPMNTRPPMSLADLAQAQASGSSNNTPNNLSNMANSTVSTGNNNMAQQTVSPNNGFGQNNTQSVGGLGQNTAQSNNGFGQTNIQPAVSNRQRPAASGVILKKGQKTNLSKFGASLTNIDVGLGWDVSNQGVYDLDAECFLLGANDKVVGDDWFVYYNQLVSPDGAVRHSGDNPNGAGGGDDEVISLNLPQVNQQVQKIVFVVTINEARERNLNFSGVSNAYIRLVNKDTSQELCRFNLTDYYSNVTSMVVAELYRYNGEWKVNPVGDGIEADLYDLCMRYGVNVAG